MDIGSYLSLLKTGADCAVGALIASGIILVFVVVMCWQLAVIQREIRWAQYKAGIGSAPPHWGPVERQLSAWQSEG
jgi:hypothetical protein